MITTATKTQVTLQTDRVFKGGLTIREQITDNNTNHVISGVAIPFNQPSLPIPSDDGTDGFFIEQISPHALDGVDLGHVYLLQNHDPHDVLARVDSGSLTLKITDDGLAFTATLANTNEVNDLIAKINHGDVKGLSFGALVDPSDIDVTTDEIGREIHTIQRIDQLQEISITPIPAYTESQLHVIREQQTNGKENSKQTMSTDTDKLKQGLEAAIKALNGALNATSANSSQSTNNGSESASDASKSTSAESATNKVNRNDDSDDSDSSADSAADNNNDDDTERDCNTNTKRDTDKSAGSSSASQAKPADDDNSAASAGKADANPGSSNGTSSTSSSASSASTATSAASSDSDSNSNSNPNSNSQEAKKDMTRELHSQNVQPTLSKDEKIKRDFTNFLRTNKVEGSVEIKRDDAAGVQTTNGATSANTQAIIPFDTLMPLKEKHQFTRLQDLIKTQTVHHPHGEWHSFKEADQVMKAHDELAETVPQQIPELRKVRYDLTSYTANYLISQEAIDDNDENLMSDMSDWLTALQQNTNDQLIMAQLTHNGVNTKKMSANVVDDIKHVLNVDLKPNDASQASIIMSQSAFNSLDVLKDNEGRYLLNGDLSAATNKTLLGKPVVIVDDLLFPGAKAGDANVIVAPLNECVLNFLQNTIRAQYVNNWSAMDHILAIYMRESIQLVRPDLVTVITGSTATANAAKKTTGDPK